MSKKLCIHCRASTIHFKRKPPCVIECENKNVLVCSNFLLHRLPDSSLFLFLDCPTGLCQDKLPVQRRTQPELPLFLGMSFKPVSVDDQKMTVQRAEETFQEKFILNEGKKCGVLTGRKSELADCEISQEPLNLLSSSRRMAQNAGRRKSLLKPLCVYSKGKTIIAIVFCNGVDCARGTVACPCLSTVHDRLWN